MLNLLQTLFRHVSPDWESSFTDRGAKALALMAERPFDIVVSDMRMPEMNGAELLEHVRERYPHAARVVLSGYADQPMSVRSLGAAHQYLSKPFTLTSLQNALGRIFALDRFVTEPRVREVLSRLHSLPTSPALRQRFDREIASPAATGETLGGIIAQDVALTAKLFQITSSAFFGAPKQMALAREAALGLGVGLIRSIAVSHRLLDPSTGTVIGGLSLDALNRHAVATGLRASRILAFERALPDQVKIAFTGGVLHDIGKLALATTFPEQYEAVLRRAQAAEAPLLQLEREEIGVSHSQAGAYLLGLWGLPDTLVDLVACHHEPRASSRANFGPLTAVHVANHLERGTAGVPEHCLPPLDEDYLRALRVDAQRLNSWTQIGAGE